MFTKIISLHIILWGDDMYMIYQVQSGDTLASLANRFGLPINELANLNGIMQGAVLNPGDYMVVPKMENDNLYFNRYVIQNGDTIYSIARLYNVKPNYLLRLNGLNEADVIYPGDVIFVPKENVSFFVTGNDSTLNDVVNELGASTSELANQNNTIYLTNDQLIVYKK